MENGSVINEPIVKSYFKQIKKIADDLDINASEQMLQAIIRLPDTLKIEKQEFKIG